jgi:ABC-2 type transport system permease protein
MRRLILAELVKLTTVRLPYVLTLGGVGLLSLGATVALAKGGDEQIATLGQPGGVARAMVPLMVFTLLPLVLGLVALPGEFHHGTVVPVLLARPRRASLVVAKMVAFGLAAAVMAGVFLTVGGGIVEMWLQATGRAAPLVDATAVYFALRFVAASVAMCLFGVGVGAVVKHQVAAVAGGLIALLIGEQVIGLVLPSVARWLPFTASQVFQFGARAQSEMGTAMEAWWAAGLALTLYAGVACLAGALLLRRRDIA